MVGRYLVRAGVAAALAVLVAAAAAWSAPGKVTAAQNVVSKQPAGSTKWFAAKTGTTLDVGDRLATGKRSKAQVTFGDGSYVRLGELTDIVIRGGAGIIVEATKGHVFGKFRKGAGATIGGRSAVAAVKGTSIEFIIEPDGDEVIRCHSGQVVVTHVPPAD